MKIKIVILFLLSVALLGGCSLTSSVSKQSKTDGGIWKSTDSAKTWAHTVSVATANGKPASIANVDVRKIVIDPSDSSAIYLATENHGIIYSYDGGNGWNQFKQINKGKIYSISVDPKNKCVIYSVGEDKMFKTTDCGRKWDVLYQHPKKDVYLTDVAVDPINSQVIYLANSVGEIIKSTNAGATWSVSYREPKANLFAEIIINPKDSKIIYAATWQKGIYKTEDAGKTWNSLSEGLAGYSKSSNYKKLIIDKSLPDNLILASKFGILKSKDAGKSWEVVPLLPAPGQTNINAMAVNPKNIAEIYYATDNAVVKSVDGGKTWATQKLQFSRLPNDMVIDFNSPNIIYLGTKTQNK